MARWTRGLRRVLIASGALAACAALVVVGLLLWLNTDAGRGVLLSRLEAALAEAGLGIEVEAPAGRWPGRLRAGAIVLSDADGPWLTIEGLELDWSPAALLAGRLRIELLAADSIDFDRPPSLPPREEPAAGPGPDLPGLLRRLRVERLAVERLRLGAALIGVPATWSIDGEAGAPDPAGIVHRLDIVSSERPEDRLNLRVLQDLESGTVSLRGDLHEGPSGVLQRSLGIDTETGLSLTLAGDGPPAAWAGRLEGRAGEASLNLAFRRDGTPPTILLDGRVDPGDLLTGPLAATTAGGVELTARLRQEPSRLVLETLRLGNEALRLEAHGRYAPGDGELAATVTLEERVPDALAPLLGAAATAGVELRIEAEGTVAQPRLVLTAAAGRLALAGVDAGELVATAEVGRQGPDWALAARVDAARLAWDLAGSGALVRGPAALELRGNVADGRRLGLEELRLQLPDAEAVGTAQLDFADGTLTAPVELTITDLHSLAGLTGLDLAGRGRFDLRVARAAGTAPLEIALAGRTEAFAIDLPVVRALVTPRMTLAGRIDVGPDTGVALRGLRLAGERAVAEADLRIPPGLEKLVGEARVEVPAAAVLAPELGFELGGAARAAGRFDGPLADPSLAGTLHVDAAGVGPLRWTELDGSYELTRLASGINGPVRISGRQGGEEARIESVIALTPESFVVRDLRATAPGATAAGDVALPLDGTTAIAAELGFSLTDLGALVRASGLGGAGRGNGLLRLFPEAGGQGGRLSFAAEELRLRMGAERPVAVRGLDLDARLTAGADAPRLSLTASASGVRAPAVALEHFSLALEGDRARLEAGVEAAGELLDAPATVTGGVAARLDGDRSVFVLERLDGTLAGHPLASRAPMELAVGDGGFELTGIDLEAGGGWLRGHARLGLPSPSVELTASAFPLALLSIADPRVDVAGALNGTVRLAGTGAATVGSVELALDPIRLAQRRRLVNVKVDAAGELRDGRLGFSLEAVPPAGSTARLRGEMPLLIDLEAMTASQPPDGKLTAGLEWSGDAADLMVLLPMNDHVLRGATELELRVAGTVGAPRWTGAVTLTGGSYEHLVAGTVLAPLDLRLVGDGASLRIERLDGGAGGGRVSGSGQIELVAGRGFPADLQFEFANARLIRRDELTAVTDGRIRVEGPLTAPEIVGRFDVREVEARLQNNLPPEVVQLELVEAGSRRTGEGRQTANGEASRASADDEGRLAIEIRMPQRVFVRGLGIDSEWQGRLDVGGTPRQPTLRGRLEVVRGIMMFVGRRFRLEDSTISFAGGGEIVPELDVRAFYQGQVYAVTIEVTGPATAADIKLSSQPELPESEILSQALFDKSTGELTALEAVQLAQAVGELTGRGGGSSEVLGRLRQAVGIDVLRVGSTETETGEQATTVEAGVYVAEGLYIGAQTSTAEESGAVSVEYELTRRIRVKTDLDQTGGQNIGIEYKRDY